MQWGNSRASLIRHPLRLRWIIIGISALFYMCQVLFKNYSLCRNRLRGNCHYCYYIRPFGQLLQPALPCSNLLLWCC